MKQTALFFVAAIIIAATFFIWTRESSSTDETDSTLAHDEADLEKGRQVDALSPEASDMEVVDVTFAQADEVTVEPAVEPSLPLGLAPPSESSLPPESEAYLIWKEQRIGELIRLASERDEASMLKLVSESLNSDIEIRDTALHSLKSGRIRTAIPYLEALSEQTNDTLLQREYTNTIEFLKIESFAEYRARKAAEAAESAE